MAYSKVEQTAFHYVFHYGLLCLQSPVPVTHDHVHFRIFRFEKEVNLSSTMY